METTQSLVGWEYMESTQSPVGSAHVAGPVAFQGTPNGQTQSLFLPGATFI